MDLSKLTTADKVIAGSGIAYLIFMFFPWYGIDGFDGGESGWDYFLSGILPLVLAVVMVGQIAISRFSPSTKLPDLPLPWPRVHLIAGAAAAVLLILRTVLVAEVEAFGEDFELDRKVGLFLALIAAIGLAVGGFLKSQEGEGSGPSSSAPPTPF